MVVLAQTWIVIDNPEELADLFSDTTIQITIQDGVTGTAKYSRDGTGVVTAWGETFLRNWEVQGNDRVCITSEDKHKGESICYRLERNADNSEQYRAVNLTTEEILDLLVTADHTITPVESTNKSSGGAAKPTAEEIAASLANPEHAHGKHDVQGAIPCLPGYAAQFR